jgi:hypothetical protein
MIYIDFFGGLHGHFLEYSINALDDDVKKVNPFTRFGTSHLPYIKLLATAEHYSFCNIDLSTEKHIISIVTDFDDCLLINLLNFGRAGDYNFNLYNFEKDFAQKLKDTAHYQGFYKSLLHFGIDISRGDAVPRSVLRESLKYNFIDPVKNSLMQVIAQQKYLQNSLQIPLKKFYSQDQYLDLMKKIVNYFQLPYTIDTTWYSNLWNRFILGNRAIEQTQESKEILDAVLNFKPMDIASLTVIQEAWIDAQLENQFGKEMPAEKDKWFTNTTDINKFLGRI